MAHTILTICNDSYRMTEPYLEQVFEVLQSLRGLTSLQTRQKFRGKSLFQRTRSGVIVGFSGFLTNPWEILSKKFENPYYI